MHKTISLCLCIALAAAFGGLGNAAEPIVLFDGKTFDGWEGDTAHTWRIENGAITAGSLERAAPRNEFLATTREFEDFELSLQFKILGDEKVNAGVQFRTRRIPNHHEVSGYQADIGPEVDGHLYDESRRRRMLAAPDEDTLKKAQAAGRHRQASHSEQPVRTSPSGETRVSESLAHAKAQAAAGDDGWQTYRIRAEGERIQLWLNGVKTVDYVESEVGIERDGIIALQIHGGMKAIISYKDIVLRPL